MDRRTILFITISVMIIVLYQELVLKNYAPPPEAPVESTETVQPASPQSDAPAHDVQPSQPLEAPAAVRPPEGQVIRIETDLYVAELTTSGGRLKNFLLKKYRVENTPESPPLSLVNSGPEVELPLGIELRGSRTWSDANQVYTADRDSLVLQGQEQGSVVLQTTFEGQPITKRFTFRGDDYPIELAVSTPPAANLPAELSEAGPDGQPASVALVLTQEGHKPAEGETFVAGAAALVDGKLVVKPFADITTVETIPGAIQWAGFEEHYFFSAAATERARALQLRKLGEAVEEKILTPRAAMGTTDLTYTLYFGPKDQHTLEAAGNSFEKALNLGWFAPIALFLLRILDFSHRVTHNYGLDIIFLTVLVKIAFWPLTRKSFESMRQMQRLQPEMAKLREKFKEDPKQMNTEIMELYKRHKVNPLGGCVPMALQIPVFIGLYQLLQNMIQLRHAPFAFWIQDLAAPERVMIFGFGIPVLTVLLGVSMFVQQKLQPPAGDPTQQRIMMFMPVIFTFMFIGFPAGLTLYWLTNNVLTIAQQWWMLRNTPT